MDKAQIQPVDNSTHSKVFEVKNKTELTVIYRQLSESGLVSVLPILRSNIIYNFKESLGTEGSLHTFTDTKDFFMEAFPLFKKAIKDMDILNTKIYAYTNNRVNAYNEKLRQVLFNSENEYNRYEFITGNENLEFNNTKFWNSMDYVIIDEPVESEILIPGFIKLPGYYLNLYNSSLKLIEEVFILSKNIPKNYYDSLAFHIETTRLKAIEAKQRKSRNSRFIWKKYYEIIGSFTSPIDLYYSNRLIRKKSFGYGYASTVHKS